MTYLKRDIFTITCGFTFTRFVVIPMINKLILLIHNLEDHVLIYNVGAIFTILSIVIIFPCYIAGEFINRLERNNNTNLSQ